VLPEDADVKASWGIVYPFGAILANQ